MNVLTRLNHCDGAYWHRNKKSDYSENRYLKSHGYKLLRLSEDDIKSGIYQKGIEAAIADMSPYLV